MSALHPPDGPVVDVSYIADAARLRAVEATGLIGTNPEPALDRLAERALAVTGAPIALLSLVDSTASFFKSFVRSDGGPTDARSVAIGASLCRELVCRGERFTVVDAPEDPRANCYGAVREFPVGAYLGYPLCAEGGDVLGSFCVISPVPREFSAEESRSLERLAKLVESELRQRIRTSTASAAPGV